MTRHEYERPRGVRARGYDVRFTKDNDADWPVETVLATEVSARQAAEVYKGAVADMRERYGSWPWAVTIYRRDAGGLVMVAETTPLGERFLHYGFSRDAVWAA